MQTALVCRAAAHELSLMDTTWFRGERLHAMCARGAIAVMVGGFGAMGTRAAAQGAPPVAPLAPPSRRIAPADTALRADSIRVDTLTYTLTGYRDGDEIPVGTIVDMTTREGEGASRMLRRIMLVKRGTATLVDSTLTDAKSLAPKQHRSSQPQRVLRIDFSGMRIRGVIGPIGSSGVALDTTLSYPAFDSGNWDLIVRAMPLAPNFAAVFRVYDVETGPHDYIVRVTGTTTIYGETAYIVQFQLSRGTESTVWIGATTRRLLQMETWVGQSTLLRQALRVDGRR